jgi:two-component system response regulator
MVDVLYVEDNADDADIFSRLIRKLNRAITYTILSNGSEAVDYLTGQGRYEQQTTTLPKLVLLDLNLDGLSGIDVVHQARSLDKTRFLPIVAFSTSDNPKDIKSAYEAGVNAYVVKPGSYVATGTLLEQLCDFWLENNTRIDYK